MGRIPCTKHSSYCFPTMLELHPPFAPCMMCIPGWPPHHTYMTRLCGQTSMGFKDMLGDLAPWPHVIKCSNDAVGGNVPAIGSLASAYIYRAARRQTFRSVESRPVNGESGPSTRPQAEHLRQTSARLGADSGRHNPWLSEKSKGHERVPGRTLMPDIIPVLAELHSATHAHSGYCGGRTYGLHGALYTQDIDGPGLAWSMARAWPSGRSGALAH